MCVGVNVFLHVSVNACVRAYILTTFPVCVLYFRESIYVCVCTCESVPATVYLCASECVSVCYRVFISNTTNEKD